jgi:hypothetical protein
VNFDSVRLSSGKTKLVMFGLWLVSWVVLAYPIYVGAILGFAVGYSLGVMQPTTAGHTALFVIAGAAIGLGVFIRNARAMQREWAKMKQTAESVDATVAKMTDAEVLDEIARLAATSEHLRVTLANDRSTLTAELPDSIRSFFERFDTASLLPLPREKPTVGHFFSRSDIARHGAEIWCVGSVSNYFAFVVHGPSGRVGFCQNPDDPEQVSELFTESAEGFRSMSRYLLVFAMNFEARKSAGKTRRDQ